MASKKKILIVDDDQTVCDFVEDLLAFRFQVLKANTAEEGLHAIERDPPDIIILDLKLQNQSGLDICKTVREAPRTKHIPVLVYSGSDDLDNMTQAFGYGADDYINKTAKPKELVARILAKVRRLEETVETPDVLYCGNLTLDTQKLEAMVVDRTLPLSVLEFNLLRFFVLNKNRVMSRAQILEGVWKDAVVSNRTIDTHMVYLRKKLTDCDYILATVYGAGYIFREKAAPSARDGEHERGATAKRGSGE